jgi:hypothetical protein
MGALSRLFVALERTRSGAAGRRRIGTTPVHVVESVLFCHIVFREIVSCRVRVVALILLAFGVVGVIV